MVQDFKKLQIWKESFDFALEVYQTVIPNIPEKDSYGVLILNYKEQFYQYQIMLPKVAVEKQIGILLTSCIMLLGVQRNVKICFYL